MKKITKQIYLLLFFIVGIYNCNAGHYKSGMHWTELHTMWNDSSFCEETNYRIDGDTIINSQDYLKVYKEDELYAVLTETDDSKVYVNFVDDTIEFDYFLYDFDMEVGDTLYEQIIGVDSITPVVDEPIMQLKFIVESIDSTLLLDGNYYKYYNYTIGGSSFLVGIGWHYSLLHIGSFYICCGNQYTVSCFWDEDQIIYKASNIDECSCHNTSLLELQEAAFSVIGYNNSIVISSGSEVNSNATVFSLYDMSGKLIKESRILYGETRIDAIHTGMYSYTIRSANGESISSGKVLVK